MENDKITKEWLFSLPTPCYAVDEAKLINNLEILKSVGQRTGCRVLLAQKAFSMFSMYPQIAKYLSGTAASGLFEAQLGHKYFKKETHVYSPAYKEEGIKKLVKICDHIVFNSFEQYAKYKDICLKNGCSCGIRINPEYSTQDHTAYDPCGEYSRLGTTAQNFKPQELKGVEGLHMHTLCEQNADALVKTFEAFEAQFGKYLFGMKWLNLGGGHHITREDYDVEALVSLLNKIKEKYGVQVYLEPGEAVVFNAGYLVSSVLDIMHNKMDIAILDTSAACHMPDVIEMPYRPNIIGAGKAGTKAHTYRLGGQTCLAGDVIGDYSFDEKLKTGDKLAFCDMALYTMVKNNTFNGMPLPSIYLHTKDGKNKLIKKFGYKDFKNRLS